MYYQAWGLEGHTTIDICKHNNKSTYQLSIFSRSSRKVILFIGEFSSFLMKTVPFLVHTNLKLSPLFFSFGRRSRFLFRLVRLSVIKTLPETSFGVLWLCGGSLKPRSAILHFFLLDLACLDNIKADFFLDPSLTLMGASGFEEILWQASISSSFKSMLIFDANLRTNSSQFSLVCLGMPLISTISRLPYCSKS